MAADAARRRAAGTAGPRGSYSRRGRGALRGLRPLAAGDLAARRDARRRLAAIASAESRAALSRRAAIDRPFPGLRDASLFEGRDLRPTLDTRAALKGVVAAAFDLSAAHADRVFPGSSGVRGLYDLLR